MNNTSKNVVKVKNLGKQKHKILDAAELNAEFYFIWDIIKTLNRAESLEQKRKI